MIRSAWTRTAVMTGLALLLLPMSGRAQQSDEFFESDFDGGWVGTIDIGAEELLLQLNLNVADGTAVGTVFSHEAGDDTLTAFAPAFGRIKAKRVVVSFEPVEEESDGSSRAVATTLTLRYKKATDTLAGRAKGASSGRVNLARMDPDRPMSRLWSGTVRDGGETVPVLLQLQETPEESGRAAVEVVSGQVWVGDETGPVDGSRNGSNVELTFSLPGEEVNFSGRLRRRNSQLRGNVDVSGGLSLKLVPAGSNNGKPMRATGATSDDVAAGGSGVVTIRGRNFGTGTLAHSDDPRITVVGVDVVSVKRLDVFVEVDQAVEAGTEVALRVVNGDGQTSERSSAFTVAEEDTGGGGGISFASDVQPIFSTNCALAGCHSAASAAGGMVLASGSALSNIVNVPSSQQPQFDRIEPGDADSSYLVKKIRGDAGISGGRMPLNRTPLTATQIDTIVSWVNEGAADNKPVRE